MPRNGRPVRYWLEQIVSWSDSIADYTDGLSADDFASNRQTVDAVSWCISCIGESCGRILEVDPDFERSHPKLALKSAYSARNRYVHGYFDLDVRQIWDTARDAVPRIAAEARRILNDER